MKASSRFFISMYNKKLFAFPFTHFAQGLKKISNMSGQKSQVTKIISIGALNISVKIVSLIFDSYLFQNVSFSIIYFMCLGFFMWFFGFYKCRLCFISCARHEYGEKKYVKTQELKYKKWTKRNRRWSKSNKSKCHDFIASFGSRIAMINEIDDNAVRCRCRCRCTLYQYNIIEFVPYMCYLHASLWVSISIMIWRYEKFLTPKFMLYPRAYSSKARSRCADGKTYVWASHFC